MQTISKSNYILEGKKELEIYVHIPFCVKKCAYCDFLSAPADEKSRFVYVNALKKEIIAQAGQLEEKDAYYVSSVFVGGGTPTILTGKILADILECIKDYFLVAEDAEITFECNPGTADENKLNICRRAGYNRISIGLQSALDEELKAIGRIHNYQDFVNTYNAAVRSGFDNINVDLMSALPEQTLEKIDGTLDKILALQPRPKHISSYSLILEEGTLFQKMADDGTLNLPDEDMERIMHWKIIERLEKEGYKEYELSNLAVPGYECRHNIGYWIRREYIGVGIGAASLIGNIRRTNTRSIDEYISYWNSEMYDDNAPLSEYIELDENDVMEEFVFLGLRMTEGISENTFESQFGMPIFEKYGKIIENNIADGLVERINGRIRLTIKGQDLANYVFSQFIL